METLAFIPGMQGHTEIILVIFIILLLFGAKKLPELSRSIGKSLGEFKKGQREGQEPDKLEPDKLEPDNEVQADKKELESSEDEPDFKA